jgi:LPXTG-motif cell wall-anchored protein
MLETLNEFFANNSTLVLIGLVAIVALIGFVMFRRSSGNSAGVPIPTPAHDLEGMDNVNMVCDLANGVCMPQNQPDEQMQMQMQMQEQMMSSGMEQQMQAPVMEQQ